MEVGFARIRNHRMTMSHGGGERKRMSLLYNCLQEKIYKGGFFTCVGCGWQRKVKDEVAI